MKGTDGTLKTTDTAWIKTLAVASLLVLFAPAGYQAWAQSAGKETVADVIVVGNRNIPTEKIMRYIKTRSGGEYLQGTLQADVSRLAETRMFRSVQVRDSRLGDGRVQVYFEVQEYPNLITEIIFKNAGHINEKDLEGLVRLRKGTPLDPTTNRNCCFEIQDYLKKKGRYFASVVLEEGDKATDSHVVFNITEGPIVRIRDIRFEGHHELAGDSRLRTQMDSERAFLKSMGGKLNPAMVDSDVLKLEEYFKDHGYINIRVAREYIFDPTDIEPGGHRVSHRRWQTLSHQESRCRGQQGHRNRQDQ